LAVAPHGRPAGCSPCSTVQRHSLGPINNSQHSSNEEGGDGGRQTERRTEEEENGRKKRTQKREREEIERRREKERKPRKKKKRGENERERKRRTREKEGTPSRLLTAAPLPPSESYATATSLCRSTASDVQPPPRQVTFLLILAFISFFSSPHAERVAFCMQGWGENNSPRPVSAWARRILAQPCLLGRVWPRRKCLFGPRSAQSSLGRNRPTILG